MALDPFTRDRIARAAAGMIGYYYGKGSMNDGSKVTQPKIAQILMNRYGISDNSERAQVLATVQQEQRALNAGAALNAPGEANVPNRPTVGDWRLIQHAEPYGWQVEVTFVNDATGDRFTRAVFITAGTALTPDQIRQMAEDQASRNPDPLGIYPEEQRVTSQLRTSSRILSAGRNPL